MNNRLADQSASFLTLVDHELRTLLSAIIGTTQVIQNHPSLSAETLKEHVDSIHQSGIELLNFLNNVTDFTRLQENQMTLETHGIDLAELVKQVMKSFLAQAKQKNLDFELDYSTSAPQIIYGDPQRVKQILHHLLDNAFKFTAQGHIKINVQRSTNASAKITISDSGIGIAKENITHAFDAFSQVYVKQQDSHSKGYEGLGLGLTLAKRLTEMQNGTIELTSELHQGTTVSATFPASANMSATLLTQISHQLGHLRLLLIDDDEKRRAKLQKEFLLMRLNCQTASSSNAFEIMQQAQQQSNTFHIIMVQTTQMDQYSAQFARTLHNSQWHSPALLVLALCHEQHNYEKEQALISGYHDVLNSHQPMLFAENLAHSWHEWTHKNYLTVEAPEKNRKVLLVEDNSLNQKVAKLMLSELGCDVDTATTGHAALTALNQTHYAMVFMDIGLPDLSGLDIISRLRSRQDAQRQTPVVALTADSMLGDEQSIEEKGIDAYLVKPLDLDLLKGIIQQYMG